jgi:hypothetical protein
MDGIVVNVPHSSGKISLGNFAEDLKAAYRNAPQDSDPWDAVAKRAVELAPRVIPDED